MNEPHREAPQPAHREAPQPAPRVAPRPAPRVAPRPARRARRGPRRALSLAAALAGTLTVGVTGLTLPGADEIPGAGTGPGLLAGPSAGTGPDAAAGAGAQGHGAAGPKALRGWARPAASPAPGTSPGASPARADRAPDGSPLRIPGLGPKTLARVPAHARQVLVVTGAGPDANRGTARLYTRTKAGGWLPGRARPARNALRGWTDDHRAGDLRSPAGVYRIGDAGGRLPNPGTRLPYDRSDDFAEDGTGFTGESLTTAFDHVLAIDYNRVAGVSPLDRTRPLGESRGGGIWLHVDHGGPTHGCVSLARADLVALLKELRPELRPVIAMGDGERLAR